MSSTSILVLMSDDVERTRMEGILLQAGHEVISVSSVESASEHLAVEPLDLFICAYEPGAKSRISLLTAAKWRLPYLARLLLIDEDDSRTARKALETGIVHFTLVPPVSSTVLLDTTAALLRWAQERRLGTPAPQTGRNSNVRHHLRDTVDDGSVRESEPDDSTGPTDGPEQELTPESESPRTSAARGRAEWYY